MRLEKLDIAVRKFGIKQSEGPHVSSEMLDRYPDMETAALLVAGHGNPTKGVRLGNGYWDPRRVDWRLERTECAVLPSCRLGELLLEGHTTGDAASGAADRSKSELTGFVAHLCLAGIPRVLACPWVAYDTPTSDLITRIFAEAIRLRKQPQPHYWARGIREVIVSEVRSPDGCNAYDIANLLLFGAP